LQRVPCEADDGIRTHDLLHGKRVVGSVLSGPEAASLSGIRRAPRFTDAFRITLVCGRFLAVWALDRLLCPNAPLLKFEGCTAASRGADSKACPN
jgi:hypothetical protein